METKHIIAIEIKGTTSEKVFELYEIDNKLFVAPITNKTKIPKCLLKSIGFTTVKSNDWILNGANAVKKPHLSHTNITVVKTKVGFYYLRSLFVGEKIKNQKMVSRYAIDTSKDYYNTLMASVIKEEIKAYNPHYEIDFKGVFVFCANQSMSINSFYCFAQPSYNKGLFKTYLSAYNSI